jgi:hypothetical protein
MTPNDIAVLRRIKRAREQRAELALRQAQAAQLRAVKACERADLAAEFAVERRGQEASVYRELAAGPIPGQRLRQAAAQLSGIVVYAEVLGQRATQQRDTKLLAPRRRGPPNAFMLRRCANRLPSRRCISGLPRRRVR